MSEGQEEVLHRMFGRARLDDRQVNEMIGISHGILADGKVTQEEARYLHNWLEANVAIVGNPVVDTLLHRVQGYLKDGVLDDLEAADLFDTLKKFAGGTFDIRSMLQATRLPLDEPAPMIEFAGRQFCFTGTFAFGGRRDCERAVADRGAKAGNLTMSTDYLVIGIYATGSWAHSSYGRKIEKALDLNKEGRARIAIISEEHWVGSLNA